MRKRVLIFAVLVLIVASGVLVLKKKRERIKKLAVHPLPPISVETAAVKKGSLELVERYIGTVAPLNSAYISTKLSGRIERISVREGDKVKKGQVLVLIEASGVKSKIEGLKSFIKAKESDVEVKRKIFERNLKLYRNGAISKEELELSKAAFLLSASELKKAKEELKALVEELSYAEIKAPFNGVVTKRFKDPGDLATPGSPILKLESTDAYRVLVRIPEAKSAEIGRDSPVYIEHNGLRINAYVHRVFPETDEAHLAVAEIRLKEKPFGLPTGSKVIVGLVIKRISGLLIPERALVPGRDFVFVVRSGLLRKIRVRVLGVFNETAAVEGDLKPGERVVVGDPGLLIRLHDGERVEI